MSVKQVGPASFYHLRLRDHPEPTEFVKSVIEGFGFVAVYLGGLATGGRLQQAGGPLAGRDLVDFGSL